MESFELIEDEQRRLVLRRPGRDDAADVRVRRAFPWSAPDRYVSVRDSEGKELLLIDSLEPLEAGLRAAIARALGDGSFVPRITAVQDVDMRFGYLQWKVTTDRGPAEFRVQEREDIRFLPDGRFRIKDADGTVYEMLKLNELDEASRTAVEPLL